MKIATKVILSTTVIIAVLLATGMPPAPWIEKAIYARKADQAIHLLTSPDIPNGLHGNVLTFTDGWMVLTYGQSSWTGHNAWNHNLAKDSHGDVYVSERHFCTDILSQVKIYKQTLDLSPLETNEKMEGFRTLVDADSLNSALEKLQKIGFSKQ